MSSNESNKLLKAAKNLFTNIATVLEADLSIRLWDGSIVPLGQNASSNIAIKIAHQGVIPSMLRRPTLDRFIRHYIAGDIDFEGGSLLDIGYKLQNKSSRKKLKQLSKTRLLLDLLPFLFASSSPPARSREFAGDDKGERRSNRNEVDYIQFHYDVSNEFYQLFLDEEMIYTCGYFTDWNNSLDQAQYDKLEMICRKLRLKPGERFLDIGCGWGGLVCHAAKHHGVIAHGVTLSKEQYEYSQKKIQNENLGDQVTVELKDYRDLTGIFDKISSIGMYEAIGVQAVPEYIKKVRSMLATDGLFLNHGITRKAKHRKTRFSARPEQRALTKYIFPGGELDDIGHTVQELEKHGFEIHDVEGWREHYALTTKHWCERLTLRKEEAISIVGEETYRIWVAYLAGCSLAFTRGSARLYQTLAGHNAKGRSPLPPTRADLYKS